MRRAQVHPLPGSCAAGYQVGAHSICVISSGVAESREPTLKITQRDVSNSLDMTSCVFRFAQHDTLERRRQRAATCLFQQRTTRFLERRIRDHNRSWRIRGSGIIDALHFRSKCRVLRLGISDVYRSPDAHHRVKLCRRFAMQPNAAMCMRGWMDKSLMKTIGGSELAPVTHRISDITAGAATGGRYDPVALHAESIRPGAFVLLFGIDFEVAFRSRFRSHANVHGRS